MILKPVYESMPYVCFVVGSIIWLSGSSAFTVIAGILLFCAGAWQWILRTSYRRSDRTSANLIGHNPRARPKGRSVIMPRTVYELMPFAYIATGYLITTMTRFQPTLNGSEYSAGLMLIASALLAVSGFVVLLLRGVHRLAPRNTKFRILD